MAYRYLFAYLLVTNVHCENLLTSRANGFSDPYSLSNWAGSTSLKGNDSTDTNALFERQSTKCPGGTYACPNIPNGCCEFGNECRPDGPSGRKCCPFSSETCGRTTCATPGSVCCPGIGNVCPPGSVCNGALCCEPGDVLCPGNCCPAGSTCGAGGTCMRQTTSRSTSTSTSTSTSFSTGYTTETFTETIGGSTRTVTRTRTSTSASISTSVGASTSISRSISTSMSTSTSTRTSTSSSSESTSSDNACETGSPNKRGIPSGDCPTERHPESPWSHCIPVLEFVRVEGVTSELVDHICQGIRNTAGSRVPSRSDGVSYDILTRGSGPSKPRRRASGCPGYCRKNNLDTKVVSCDEYPPAAAAEGGSGSDIQCINKVENEYIGGPYLGTFLNSRECNIEPGDPFIIRVQGGCSTVSNGYKRDFELEARDENTTSGSGSNLITNAPNMPPYIALSIDNMQTGHYGVDLNIGDPASVDYAAVFDSSGEQYSLVSSPASSANLQFDLEDVDPDSDDNGIIFLRTDKSQNVTFDAKLSPLTPPSSGALVRVQSTWVVLGVTIAALGLVI